MWETKVGWPLGGGEGEAWRGSKGVVFSVVAGAKGMYLGASEFNSALRESLRVNGGFTYFLSSVSKASDCYSRLTSAHANLHAIHRDSFAGYAVLQTCMQAGVTTACKQLAPFSSTRRMAACRLPMLC